MIKQRRGRMIDKIKSKYGILFFVILSLIGLVYVSSQRKSDQELLDGDNENNNRFEVESLREETEVLEAESFEEEKSFIVDIKGEVKRPGIYEAQADMRVNDIIDFAGGTTDTADELSVNRAERVKDEMVIYVAHVDEELELAESSAVYSESNGLGVKVNQASKEELTELTGIGPAKADAIISYREENGGFKSVEDLLNVPGIGEKSLEVLKNEVIIP